jgi:hypothetical protein
MDDRLTKAAPILDSLREIELLIAELYRGFAEAFEEDRTLWEGLSREEESHARLVSGLKEMAGETAVPESLKGIHLAALGTYRKGLEYQLGRLRKGEVARVAALSIARDLERTLVERLSHEIFRGGAPEQGAIAGRLRDETESHRARLEAYLAGIAGGPRRSL